MDISVMALNKISILPLIAFSLSCTLHAGLAEENDIDIVFMREDAPRVIKNNLSINQNVNELLQQNDTTADTTPQEYNEQIRYTPSTNDYFYEAGQYYGVDPRLLWCVAKVESGFNPKAINKNTNGTYDIGMMQINSIHLGELRGFGITKDMLFNPRISAFVGAYYMKKCINKHGMTKNGITCYNGRIKNNPYADKVLKVFYEQEARMASR